VDLNPVCFNAAGESVGPNWYLDHPDDYPGQPSNGRK
jgi:hypothetical protein